MSNDVPTPDTPKTKLGLVLGKLLLGALAKAAEKQVPGTPPPLTVAKPVSEQEEDGALSGQELNDRALAKGIDQMRVHELVQRLRRGPRIELIDIDKMIPPQLRQQGKTDPYVGALVRVLTSALESCNTLLKDVRAYTRDLRNDANEVAKMLRQVGRYIQSEDMRDTRIKSLEAETAALRAQKNAVAPDQTSVREAALTTERDALVEERDVLLARLAGAERRLALREDARDVGEIAAAVSSSFQTVAVAPSFWDNVDPAIVKRATYDNEGAFPPIIHMDQWCRFHLAGRLVLTDRAMDTIRDTRFGDHALMYAALLLLACEYRDLALATNGAERKAALKAFNNKAAAFGLEETPSAAHTTRKQFPSDYNVTQDGRSFELDRHLKSGLARNEETVFRCYFTFDKQTSQVIVGDMPRHLRNTRS